jgi:two-component system sensor histidine kinase MprB
MGDAALLDRAINNLISNADKFSEPGEVVSVVSRGGMVSVRDHGPGIASEDRDRVFDRFYRSESTRSMPGSGLGLSIVDQIVSLHGGDVWVGDAEGGGAEVGFRLPIAESAPAAEGSDPGA